MNAPSRFFTPLARLLHWLMALMVVAMLFIGAGMVASVSQRHEWLLHLHKPLGIAILALVIVRLVVRFRRASRRCLLICRCGRCWRPRRLICCCMA